jgi:hypothetical protein
MHAIKNLTRQVVLLRLNSGAEINLAPEGQLENVAPAELNGNRTIEKLKRLGMIEVPTAKVTRTTRAASASATPAEDQAETEDKVETDEPRREAAEPRKHRR